MCIRDRCPYCAKEPTTHKPKACKMRPYKSTSGSATPESLDYPSPSEAKGKPKSAQGKGPKGPTPPKAPGILDPGAPPAYHGRWADAEEEDDDGHDGSARSSKDDDGYTRVETKQSRKQRATLKHLAYLKRRWGDVYDGSQEAHDARVAARTAERRARGEPDLPVPKRGRYGRGRSAGRGRDAFLAAAQREADAARSKGKEKGAKGKWAENAGAALALSLIHI